MRIHNEKLLFLASIFFQHAALGLIVPIIVVWQKIQGLSFAEIGIIQAIGLLTLVLSELPSSFLADRYGRKRTVVLGLLSILLSFIALYSATTFISFLIVDALQKLGLSLLSGTEESYLHDLSNDDSNNTLTKDLGKMSIADETGTLIGMGLMSVILLFGEPTIGFAIGGMFVFTALPLILLTRAEVNTHSSAQHTPDNIFGTWKKYVPLFVLACIANAFISERGAMIFQAQFDQVGLALGSFGFIYMFAKLFSILGSWFAHSFEQKLGVKNTISVAVLLQVIAFGFLLSLSTIMAILALCIFFFTENIIRNVRSSFILKIVPSHLKATSLSVVSFSSAIVLSIILPVIGYAADLRLSLAVGILIFIKLAAFGMVLFLKKT